MPPKRQGPRAELLLASPTPTVLRDVPNYVPAYDLILLRNANDVEEGWMGFRSSEILRQGLEGGPIVLRARGFRKISALTEVTTPVTLFVLEKQQRPRPYAAVHARCRMRRLHQERRRWLDAGA
ncbi:hypothetical protein ALC56_11044 [Trachymyrmex septentrionalis]|uniref:Uncharacterized protein n=1 Tax=Trachymyrmex septentrionalis TaxID=34720 RepID=A0A195F2E7_9HYME|nr:hypothetical protein ALC56_11044 [Trachymyrmex septentrionalis]